MTSKYIQIYNGLLIEYRYTSIIDPIEHSPTEYEVELVKDTNRGVINLFNTPDNYITTTNVRDYSSIYLDDKTFVSLNKDLPLQYLDYDSNFTNTDSLLQTGFPITYKIKYDEIRIHIASNFNFSDKDGLIFEFYVTRRDEKIINLSTITYRKIDDFALLNPNPTIFGEKIYNRYIDIKIPSLYFLLLETKDSNNLTSRLTENLGFISTSKININLFIINSSRKENSFTYYDVIKTSQSSFNFKDEYELLVAKLNESSAGDYYELYGEYNGIIFEDFINTLNNQPDSDYVAFHEITVNEQIGIEFIETARQINLQTTNFDKPLKYRPIIENASQAVAYSIIYVLRLINQVDGSQILKTAQIISYDTKKYGKNLKRINLPLPHVIDKIYNKVENVSYSNSSYSSNDRFLSTSIIKQEYINIFNERVNIVIGTSKINIDNFTNIEIDINNLKFENEAIINITPYDDFIMFNFYKKIETDIIPINLGLYGDIYLNFPDNTVDVKIKEYLKIENLNNNQKIFKISKQDSTKLYKFTNNKFYITHSIIKLDEESDESLIYSGYFKFL